MHFFRPLPAAAALSLAILSSACGSNETAVTLEDLPATGSSAPTEQSAEPAAVTDDVRAEGAEPARVTTAITPATGYQDPVCGMAIAKDAPLRHTHDEVTYGFCSAGCRAAFVEDPDAFLVAMEE